MELANKSDCLIHEATLENAFEEKALSHGHSTPRNFQFLAWEIFLIIYFWNWILKGIAAEAAKSIEAKCLILNHFSQRYKPIDYLKETTNKASEEIKSETTNEDEIEDSVQKLVDEAKLTFSGPVTAAYDFFTYRVV